MANYRRRPFGRIAALIATLPMASIANHASAQTTDIKSYPSTMCVVESGTLKHTHDKAYFSGGFGTMLCPAIKDRYGSSYIQNAYMKVLDSYAGGDWSCMLILRNANGGSADWDSDTTAGTPGYDTLYFSVGGVTASDWDASYVFRCEGPSSTSLAVNSYRVEETNLYE